MSRQLTDVTHRESAVEGGLFVANEANDFINRDLRLVKFLVRHREARQIQIANAQGRVEVARQSLRALEAELSEIQGQDEECAKVEDQLVADFELKRREFGAELKIISLDARALGFKHTRPELTDCSPSEKALV